jgi:hypothetical protein
MDRKLLPHLSIPQVKTELLEISKNKQIKLNENDFVSKAGKMPIH